MRTQSNLLPGYSFLFSQFSFHFLFLFVIFEQQELYTGVIQFISCLYVLPVVPFQMKRCGYDETSSIIATSATCAIGSIIGGFLTDMPLIVAPPTSVSIFLAVSIQQQNLGMVHGNTAVMVSGAALALIGLFPPLMRLVVKVM